MDRLGYTLEYDPLLLISVMPTKRICGCPRCRRKGTAEVSQRTYTRHKQFRDTDPEQFSPEFMQSHEFQRLVKPPSTVTQTRDRSTDPSEQDDEDDIQMDDFEVGENDDNNTVRRFIPDLSHIKN